ncbi:ATP-binding cassette domain-containing protein [candidate division KSB3 bacterium]|uniref:ATP-binding cassette domain-containing protein n=1 Tax=candidate division KSB3 bacterium TaxID=2044937 RepID=A0A9D5JY55_9BACT|nr:ATP-binding cassette domain-containing protein [candidate division KSB3 bacterium]MBD3326469.1 ATP-binding cassette domain-containing protein [candidate division KSB3 bacterium]
MNTTGQELVKMVNISKMFGPIRALSHVDFDVNRKEIIALVGDNGAGKSTLVRILSGIWQPSEGEMYFEGTRVPHFSPDKAEELGIQAVHQGFGLVNTMDIQRNVFLGSEPYKGGFLRLLDFDKMKAASREVLQTIGVKTRITPESEVATLSGGEKQAIKIGRAVYYKAKLIIMDEPTIALSVRERHRVLEITQEIKEKGISVIFISHNIHIIYDICDRVVIMEGGEKVGDFRKDEISLEDVIGLIREGKLYYKQQGQQ